MARSEDEDVPPPLPLPTTASQEPEKTEGKPSGVNLWPEYTLLASYVAFGVALTVCYFFCEEKSALKAARFARGLHSNWTLLLGMALPLVYRPARAILSAIVEVSWDKARVKFGKDGEK